MASSNSSRSSVASAPRHSTVTRSMSRRSLAPVAEDAGLGHAADPSSRPRLPAKTPPRAGLPRSRTTTADLASSASLPRARSTASIAARTSQPAAKLATSQLTSSRSRRVLAEANAAGTASLNRGTASSTSSTMSTRAAGSTTKPATAARRYSRSEAGKMTGMGVVRPGPAVQGQRASPRKSASSNALARDAAGGATNDPFSTSFVRPTFDFEVSGEREVKPLPRAASMTRLDAGEIATTTMTRSSTRSGLSALAEEPTLQESFDDMTTSAGAFELSSPRKRGGAASGASMARSPSARQLSIFGDGSSADMDLDGGPRAAPAAGPSSQRLAIPASSPVRGALSPRSLTGRAPLTRKLDEIESDSSEEDDIDFLSPRKKAAKRIHLSAPSPVAGASSPKPFAKASPSKASAGTSGQVDDDGTIHAPVLPRSPPPKKRAVPPLAVAGSIAPVAKSMPASVPMQRGGRTFPLPSSLTAPASSSMPPPLRSANASASSAMLPPLAMPRARAPAPVKQEERSLSASTRTGARPLRLANSAAPAAPPANSSRLPRPARVPVAQSAPTDQNARRVLSPPPPPVASTVADDSMAVDADVSMCSAADVSTVSTASTTSSTSSRSEETARRLANLQSMLSRLQMPKPSVPSSRRTSAEGAAETTSTSVVSSSRDYEVPLAPAHEPVVTRRSGTVPRSRTSLHASVVGPPPSVQSTSHVAPLLPSGPTAPRRRSSVVPRPTGGIVDTSSSSSSATGPLADVSMSSASSSTSTATARSSTRRISSATLPSSASMSFSIDSAGAAALCESVGRPKTKGALHGVVACVDVRTAEGDDSGMVFVDLLKSLGARVTARPSSVTTHIVFKAGRASTLQFHRSLAPSSRPHLVGIAWVVRCAELGARADEAPFKVEDAAAPVPGMGKENAERDVAAATAQAALGLGSAPTKGSGGAGGAAGGRRRKSMEPKALAALGNGAGDASFGGGAAGGAAGSARDAALKASIAASIERARRKSLQFMPRVGSPLAKRVFVMPDAPEEEEENDE